MELIQIRYFITAAQFQNLSKAARVLNVTQPALSKSMSKLERELGVPLFDRSGKKVALNENGERFLEYAINSMKDLDDAVAAVNNHTPRPALYIGMFHHSARFLRCLGDFSAENPEVCFQVKHLEIPANDIDTNEFDMLLYPQNPMFQKYKGSMIYSDPYLLAIHRSHPLACRESVHLAELVPFTVMFIQYGNKLFDLPYHFCQSLGLHINDCLFINSYEFQRFFISNNYGAGFVPQGGSETYAADPDIALLPVADEGFYREIMIGFKRDKHLCPAGKQFAAYVREYFGV